MQTVYLEEKEEEEELSRVVKPRGSVHSHPRLITKTDTGLFDARIATLFPHWH